MSVLENEDDYDDVKLANSLGGRSAGGAALAGTFDTLAGGAALAVLVTLDWTFIHCGGGGGWAKSLGDKRKSV